MKKRILVFMILLTTPMIYAHGLYIQVSQKAPFTTCRAVYEGDIPLPFAQVTVFAPNGEEHQNGRTDRLGRFTFQHDQPGLWKITVDDEMGHQQSIELILHPEKDSIKGAMETAPCSPWLKWLLGVSLILLMTLALVHWKKKA